MNHAGPCARSVQLFTRNVRDSWEVAHECLNKYSRTRSIRLAVSRGLRAVLALVAHEGRRLNLGPRAFRLPPVPALRSVAARIENVLLAQRDRELAMSLEVRGPIDMRLKSN